jgi:hypothetical protein
MTVQKLKTSLPDIAITANLQQQLTRRLTEFESEAANSPCSHDFPYRF